MRLYFYIADVVEWSRELDIRLSGWCCSVSMEWVQILSRENTNLSAQRSNSNTVASVGLNYQTNFHFNHECQHIFPVRLCCYCLKNLNFLLMEFFLLTLNCDTIPTNVSHDNNIGWSRDNSKRRINKGKLKCYRYNFKYLF